MSEGKLVTSRNRFAAQSLKVAESVYKNAVIDLGNVISKQIPNNSYIAMFFSFK